MKYKILFYLFFLFLSSVISCKNNNNEPEWMSKIRPEYDQERQVIYFKEQLRKDIKADLGIDLGSFEQFKVGCEFSFFNYGEDIRLCNGIDDDVFHPAVGTIHYIHVLQTDEHIEIASKGHSEKYGDWALVNLAIGDNFVKDVFMTPFSMRAFKSGDKSHFIFVQFVASNKHMNVLFYGDSKECIIVEKHPNIILPRAEFSPNIDVLKNGPGQFWYLNSDTN